MGYDYNAVLDWNIGAFFIVNEKIGKVFKAKNGIK
jgi:hypothetical protein